MSAVVGAVLAAGSGSRMGRPKAELLVEGQRLVDRAVRVLREGGCGEVVAVVRAGVDVPGAQVAVNPDPGRGMRSSLELAVVAAGSAETLAVVLVDMPGVTAEAVRAVLAAWRPERIAVGRYAGRRGHPTVMAPALWRMAVQLAGPDEGARALLRARPDLVDEVAVPGSAEDLDVPADVARWDQRAALSIRDAGAADVPALRDIYRRAALANPDDAPALLARPELLELPAETAALARVALTDGRPVGFAVSREGGSVAELDKLFVDPDRWRGGIGRALVEDALARARSAGARQLELTANAASAGFYERVGFRVAGTVETALGPALRLRKTTASC